MSTSARGRSVQTRRIVTSWRRGSGLTVTVAVTARSTKRELKIV
ncbi:MAG: hypothetical protein ABIQ18_20875 [Umezawaea sp.]